MIARSFSVWMRRVRIVEVFLPHYLTLAGSQCLFVLPVPFVASCATLCACSELSAVRAVGVCACCCCKRSLPLLFDIVTIANLYGSLVWCIRVFHSHDDHHNCLHGTTQTHLYYTPINYSLAHRAVHTLILSGFHYLFVQCFHCSAVGGVLLAHLMRCQI